MAEEKNRVDEQINDTTQATASENVEGNATQGAEADATVDQNTPETNQIADLEAQLAAMEDKFLRSQAEIANMHTRFKKEQETMLKYEGTKLAKAVIPAVDNLERALAVPAEGEAAEKLKTGVEMVLKTVNQALESNDIKAVGEVGEAFDPTCHQAIQSVPADEQHPADTIVNVLQKGYMLKDRVLRPAMVSVAQ